MDHALRGLVAIYHQVARTYELVNHVLTFGLDVRWRRRAARLAVIERPVRCLDVCSGTAEMAAEVARLRPYPARVVAADLSVDMLREGQRKRARPGLEFSLAEAERLPFAEASFDLVTISFATRNIHRDRDSLMTCLREFHRVLRPGGIFLNLETSQPHNRLWRGLFHFYVRLAVRPVGRILSGSRSGYAYLAHTIPRFYGERDLTALLEECGFATVTAQSMLGGIAAIHLARKQLPLR